MPCTAAHNTDKCTTILNSTAQEYPQEAQIISTHAKQAPAPARSHSLLHSTTAIFVRIFCNNQNTNHILYITAKALP